MSCGFTKGENVDVLYLKINDVLEYNPPYVQSDFMCNPGCTFRPWLNWLWIALYFQPTFYFSMFTVNHRGVPSVITTFQFRFRYWQCDQIGRFLKVCDNKIASKRIPNDWQLFGLFWKTSLLCSNCIGYFWRTFGKNWATFYPNICSHCWNFRTTFLPSSAQSLQFNLGPIPIPVKSFRWHLQFCDWGKNNKKATWWICRSTLDLHLFVLFN